VDVRLGSFLTRARNDVVLLLSSNMQQNSEQSMTTPDTSTIPLYEGADVQNVNTAVQDEPATPRETQDAEDANEITVGAFNDMIAISHPPATNPFNNDDPEVRHVNRIQRAYQGIRAPVPEPRPETFEQIDARQDAWLGRIFVAYRQYHGISGFGL